MTNENPGGSWPSPSHRSDDELALDPSTSPAVLSSLAEDRPGVRPLVAVNPSTPVHTLMWLHSLHDPVIDLALRRNPTATAANVVRPGGSELAAAPTTAGAIAAVVAGPTAEAPPANSSSAQQGAAALAAPVATGGAAAGAGGSGGRRYAAWAILLVPLLAALGLWAVSAALRDPAKTAGPTVSVAVTSTLAPAAGPSTQATATPTTAAAPPVAPSSTAVAATPAPATPAPATPAPATPTSAPATTVRRSPTTRAATPTTVRPATTVAPPPTTIRPTASVGTTTVPPTVLGTSVSPTTTAVASASARNTATAVAQRFATALATSDWATARKLNPAGALTDAKYGADYGNLTDSTVIPAKATALGANRYDLRLGLVAHETTAAGAQSTLLYCVHWNVDTATNTVVQVDGHKVRTAAGRVEAATVAAELTSACATAALK